MADNILLCSFHTRDDFYSSHARRLQKQADGLGIRTRILPIEKKHDEEWPEICRKKVSFLWSCCNEFPDHKIFWTDVDCELLYWPEFVNDFSADIIGFQRGFSNPLKIGYVNRSRFWEPSFWGVNTTISARKFIQDAHEAEQAYSGRATDDYFFEESWRKNCEDLSFQIIPSRLAAIGDRREDDAFFAFGSSGQVSKYKNAVDQHISPLKQVGRNRSLFGGLKENSRISVGRSEWPLFLASRVQRLVPDRLKPLTRNLAEKSGLTKRLLNVTERLPNTIQRKIVAHGKNGMSDAIFALEKQTRGALSRTPSFQNALQQGYAFSVLRKGERPVDLVWWHQPSPGNFGDWLSPYIYNQVSGRATRFQSPVKSRVDPHIISIGSIGKFAQENSILVGTGISRRDADLNPNATYLSVRGPYTAKRLVECGGPRVENFGDPGILLSRIFPIDRHRGQKPVGFVRHYVHSTIPVILPDHVEELDVRMSHPKKIEEFLRKLNGFDYVITSAMHVMVACHSYGIPCALIKFESEKHVVHGDGVKYLDYLEGVGLPGRSPILTDTDFRNVDLSGQAVHQTLSEEVMNRVHETVMQSLDELDRRRVNASPRDEPNAG